MGGCTGGKSNNPNSLKPLKFNQVQISLLSLIFDDLACRSKDNKLVKQVFNTFFHLNGLWAHEMFRRFDTDKNNEVTRKQFLQGMEMMVKAPLNERIDILFDFYDVHKNGGVSFQELLKMLYSYPKEEIKNLMNEEKFVQSLDDFYLSYVFGQTKPLVEHVIVQEDEQKSSNSSQDIARKHSQYMPTSTQFIKIQDNLRKAIDQQREKKKKNQKILLPKLDNNKLNAPSPFTNGFKPLTKLPPPKKIKKKHSASMVFTSQRSKRKNVQVTSNLASLVKKYALFLFKQMNLDRNKGDEMSKSQFQQLIKSHLQISNTYFSGFHSYAWQTDQKQVPEYASLTPWIQSQCECIFKNLKERRYLKFIKTTLLVFVKQNDWLPKEIKSMEGLNVAPITVEGQYGQHGIVIKHRDGLYPQKKYIFKTKQLQADWLRHLAQYRSNTIYNQYQLLQRIGAGNFSEVYRGKQKTSGKQYAIKVIEKFKLTMNEKEVIALQCKILSLCHHPSIVKFIKQYDTKTHIYIITELFTEGDLFDYVKSKYFLQQFQAVIVFKQLVQAILHLNQLGLIHRDLKPQNVMVITNKQKKIIQRVKIIDFGFAVYIDNLKNLPDHQKYAGTPGFIAPQIIKRVDFDSGVDVFSLGVILYFMLCGYFPFASPMYEQVIQQTVECNICLQNAHWGNVSPMAKQLIMKMLTFKEQRIDLRQILDQKWIRQSDSLVNFVGKNKKLRYI